MPIKAAVRKHVYERGKRRCWLCQLEVPWEYYDCGHLVNRVFGGPETPDNLVVMCYYCNRYQMGFHRTRAEAFAWRKQFFTNLAIQACLTQWDARFAYAMTVLEHRWGRPVEEWCNPLTGRPCVCDLTRVQHSEIAA